MGVRLRETVDVQRGAQRFRELMVYISSKSAADPHFGAIKLNKILYYSDFRAFERFGVPLTGYRYVKRRNGPAPKALVPIRDALIEEGALRLDYVPVGGVMQHRTVAMRPAILSLFTEDELQIVDGVISDLWSQNGTEVSNASHDIRWKTLQMDDPMPYELAYLSNEAITEHDRRRTEALAAEFAW